MEDAFFMKEALKLAAKAGAMGEIPVGALIVKEGKIIAKGFNQKESRQSPLLHAEMEAVRRASLKLKSWRLEGSEIFVTLEPCLMCFGAIVEARLSRLVYAAPDKRKKSFSSYPIPPPKRLKIAKGVLKKESGARLEEFFKQLRKSKRA